MISEAKLVKRWWTSGQGTGFTWIWKQKFDRDPFFFEYWASSGSSHRPAINSCMVLEADIFYQWKAVDCKGAEPTDTPPAHHFICQRPLLPLPITNRRHRNQNRNKELL